MASNLFEDIKSLSLEDQTSTCFFCMPFHIMFVQRNHATSAQAASFVSWLRLERRFDNDDRSR